MSKRKTRIGASFLFGVHKPRTNCDSDCVRAAVTPWSRTGTGTRGSAALKDKPGLFSAWLTSHMFSSSCPSCGSAYAPSSTVHNRTPVAAGSASFGKSKHYEPRASKLAPRPEKTSRHSFQAARRLDARRTLATDRRRSRSALDVPFGLRLSEKVAIVNFMHA